MLARRSCTSDLQSKEDQYHRAHARQDPQEPAWVVGGRPWQGCGYSVAERRAVEWCVYDEKEVMENRELCILEGGGAAIQTRCSNSTAQFSQSPSRIWDKPHSPATARALKFVYLVLLMGSNVIQSPSLIELVW